MRQPFFFNYSRLALREVHRRCRRDRLKEDLPEDQWPVAPPQVPLKTEFDFEEERLTKAFSSLSLERQEVLTLLFLYDLKPKDAAALLHFQLKDFYNAKYQAIKKLRTILAEEEETTDEP